MPLPTESEAFKSPTASRNRHTINRAREIERRARAVMQCGIERPSVAAVHQKCRVRGRHRSLARVRIPAAPIDEPAAEIQANLDLDAIDLEAGARLRLRPRRAREIGVFQAVDLGRRRDHIPARGVG